MSFQSLLSSYIVVSPRLCACSVYFDRNVCSQVHLYVRPSTHVISTSAHHPAVWSDRCCPRLIVVVASIRLSHASLGRNLCFVGIHEQPLLARHAVFAFHYHELYVTVTPTCESKLTFIYQPQETHHNPTSECMAATILPVIKHH